MPDWTCVIKATFYLTSNISYQKWINPLNVIVIQHWDDKACSIHIEFYTGLTMTNYVYATDGLFYLNFLSFYLVLIQVMWTQVCEVFLASAMQFPQQLNFV